MTIHYRKVVPVKDKAAFERMRRLLKVILGQAGLLPRLKIRKSIWEDEEPSLVIHGRDPSRYGGTVMAPVPPLVLDVLRSAGIEATVKQEGFWPFWGRDKITYVKVVIDQDALPQGRARRGVPRP